MLRLFALFLTVILLTPLPLRAEPLQKRDEPGREVVIPSLSDESSRWNEHIPASAQALLSLEDFHAYQAALKAGDCVAARDILFDKGFAVHYPTLRKNLESEDYFLSWRVWISSEWYPAYARCDGLARAKAGRMLAALARYEMRPYRPPEGSIDGLSREETIRNRGLDSLFKAAMLGYSPAMTDLLDFEKSGDVRLTDQFGLFFRLILQKKHLVRAGFGEEIAALRARMTQDDQTMVKISSDFECWNWIITDCPERSQWRGGPPLPDLTLKDALRQWHEKDAGSR